MSKGRQGAREKRARKYFRGGTMPDGLELFPLNGGKLEIMQEIMEASAEDDLSEDDLGYCTLVSMPPLRTGRQRKMLFSRTLTPCPHPSPSPQSRRP